MKAILIDLAERYGIFVISGLIGAIVQRFRRQMALKRFLFTLFVSSFIGLCVGIIAKYAFNFPEEVSFVVCSIFGAFAINILDEIEQIIKLASVWVRKILKIDKDDLSD
jgi:hypothetical protein